MAAKRAMEERAYLSNAQFMTQRNEEMTRIQQALVDVNVIFKDLAVVINDQGEQLDVVEANVNNARDDVVGGKRELRKREGRLTVSFVRTTHNFLTSTHSALQSSLLLAC